MRKYNKTSAKGKWFDFPKDKELKLFIKPFSIFTMNKLPSETTAIDVSDYFPSFNYSLTDWKGFISEDGKEMKCDEENKKIVYDFDQEIVTFVIDESMKARALVYEAQELKNLPKSQGGEILKTEK